MSGEHCRRRTTGLRVALLVAALLRAAAADDAYHGEGEAPDYDTRGWMGTR